MNLIQVECDLSTYYLLIFNLFCSHSAQSTTTQVHPPPRPIPNPPPTPLPIPIPPLPTEINGHVIFGHVARRQPRTHSKRLPPPHLCCHITPVCQQESFSLI